MSKSNLFENKAFTSAPSPGFNLVTQTNSFHSVFDTRPLDAKEANAIEKLLVDNFVLGVAHEGQVEKDVDQLKVITSEIKAIGKQGAVLTGERVQRAKELLKPYKDGTFTKWLESTFGSRKTGYNLLAYHDLYKALPESSRDKLKKMQQRTAYALASRQGDLEVKENIINEYHDLRHDELMMMIQEKLPSEQGDKRVKKSSNERILASMRQMSEKLRMRKESLTEDDKNALRDIFANLSTLLEVPVG